MVQRPVGKIKDLEISPYFAPNGKDIKIRLNDVSDIEIKGDVNSEYIMPLLLYTIKRQDENYANKSTALDIIKPYVDEENIYKTIIHVMENDKSPAIRMKAMSLLSKKASMRAVKEAIMEILNNDENEGVRFRALEVLEKYMDDQMNPLLLKIREHDKSDLLRNRADLLYKKYNKKT